MDRTKPWILVAAYDVSFGETTEGYVAFNIIERLARRYRIILVTRRNNRDRLMAGSAFARRGMLVRVVGFDLPPFLAWWKRGARFFRLYAYLWHLLWSLVFFRRRRLLATVSLIHGLNFHNDGMPSLAWILGRPLVWGPINHNERVAKWRKSCWPRSRNLKNTLAFACRRVQWQWDPLLRMCLNRCDRIIAAGDWVTRRLSISRTGKVAIFSQLGVSRESFEFMEAPRKADAGTDIVCAGRLDWIKGADLLVQAMLHLPSEFRLTLVGAGPASLSLRRQVMRLGIEGRVAFEPPCPRHELSILYSRMDVFAFTSAEAGGLVWVEALASGLPVVAFRDSSEINAMAGRLDGVVLARSDGTRAENIFDLARAIVSAATRKQSRADIRKTALAYYDWEQVVERVEHTYEAILAKGR